MTLMLGDCLDRMAEIPDGSVDAIITDLPYGTTRCAYDTVIPFEPMWVAFKRVLKPNGAVVTTASQPFTSALVMSNIAWFRHEWVWEKNKSSGHMNANRRPMRAHEDVLVFAAKAPTYNPQMTDGHEPGHRAKRTRQGPCYGAMAANEYGGSTKRYPRSVQKFDVVNNDDPEKQHPSQKPVDLFDYLVRTYTNAGETVLDPVMGSATTGVVCINNGRRFIGIERDPGSFEFARQRLAKARALLRPAA